MPVIKPAHIEQHCCSNCKHKTRTFFNHHIVFRCIKHDKEVQKTECCEKYEVDSHKEN